MREQRGARHLAKEKQAQNGQPLTGPVVWKNRIRGYGEEAPDQLLSNPFNFRLHPQAQQEALAGTLETIGVIQNVVVNITTQHVVDGHLRIAMAISSNQPTVPITYVELSEAEEKLALASMDPIAAMAGTDQSLLDSLIGDIRQSDLGANLTPGLTDLLDQLSVGIPFGGDDPLSLGSGSGSNQITCPECGCKFSLGDKAHAA